MAPLRVVGVVWLVLGWASFAHAEVIVNIQVITIMGTRYLARWQMPDGAIVETLMTQSEYEWLGAGPGDRRPANPPHPDAVWLVSSTEPFWNTPSGRPDQVGQMWIEGDQWTVVAAVPDGYGGFDLDKIELRDHTVRGTPPDLTVVPDIPAEGRRPAVKIRRGVMTAPLP